MITQRMTRTIALPMIAALLLTSTAIERVEARDAGLAIGAGAAVLGIIAGAALINSSRARAEQPRRVVREPREPREPRVARQPRVDRTAQIAESNRLTQKALAKLGLYSGPIDGASYPATKAAIIQFQSKLNEKPTGTLTSSQRRVLMANYATALTGQPGAPTSGADPLFAALGVGAAATATGIGVIGTINSQGVVTPGQNLPYFRNVCDDQSGGIGTAGEATFAREQFCAGRAAMLVESSETLTSLGQVDVQAVRTECRRIAESMAPKIALIATDTPVQLAQKLTKDFASSAAQRQNVITNFKVCLGVGYVEDQPEVILASGLALVGNGQGGYGEAIAGVLGIGKDPYSRPARAAEWLDFSAQQIEKGAPPVKTELGAERANVLRTTAQQLRGTGPRLIVPAAAPVPAVAALPAATTNEVARPAGGVEIGSAPAQSPAAPATAALTAAPAINAVAPAAALPSGNPAADAKAAIASQAVAFFAGEVTEQARRLEMLVTTLGLDKANLPAQCAALLGDKTKPEPTQQEAMMLRVCRSWSYSVQSKAQMYAFDQKLAGTGDVDAASRLTMHILVGNDR